MVLGMNGPAPKLALNWHPREREAQLLAELLRGSRLTILFGAAGSGKSALLRSGVLPLLHRRASDRNVVRGEPSQVIPFPDRRQQDSWERRAEVAVLFDAWGEAAPLASLHAKLVAALPVVGLAMAPPFDSLRENLRAWSDELGVSFLIVLDRFERCLTAPTDNTDAAQFVEELVQAVNEPSLQANFLIAVRDDAEPMLERLRACIPSLGDACLRLPALPQAAAPDLPARRLPGPQPPLDDRASQTPASNAAPDLRPVGLPVAGLRPAGLRPAGLRPTAQGPSGPVAPAIESNPPADRLTAPVSPAAAQLAGAKQWLAGAKPWLAVSAGCAVLLAFGALWWGPQTGVEPSPSNTAVAVNAPAAAATADWSSAESPRSGLPSAEARSDGPAVARGDGSSSATAVRAQALPADGPATGASADALPVDAAPAGAAPAGSTPTDAPSGMAPASAKLPALAALPGTPSVELVVDVHDGTDDRIARDLARAIPPNAGYTLAVRSDVSSEPPAPAAPVLAVVRHDALQAASQTLVAARKAVDGLRIVMPLYTEEIYFIARRDSPLAFIHQIHGSRINFGAAQGRRRISATMVYERMFGTPAAANASYLEDPQALDRLIVDKSLDAMIVVAAQPAQWLSQLPAHIARSIKLLKLDPEHASTQRAVESYLPAVVRAAHHRAWLAEDTPTLAAMTFLVQFNHADQSTSERLSAFTQSLCRSLPQLRRDGHPKWREVQADLQLEVGWAYSATAQSALRSCLTSPVASQRAAGRSQSPTKGAEQ